MKRPEGRNFIVITGIRKSARWGRSTGVRSLSRGWGQATAPGYLRAGRAGHVAKGDRLGDIPMVLEHTQGNHRQAAQILGIARKTLRDKLRELGVTIQRSLDLGEGDEG